MCLANYPHLKTLFQRENTGFIEVRHLEIWPSPEGILHQTVMAQSSKSETPVRTLFRSFPGCGYRKKAIHKLAKDCTFSGQGPDVTSRTHHAEAN
jgi:hypothetical protein